MLPEGGAPRDFAHDPPDVAKVSAGTGGHAQRAEEEHRPHVRTDDGPADEEGELHEEGEDAQAEERARHHRGDGARGDGDAHGGERDARAALAVDGVVFDVRVGEVDAVVHAETDDDDRGDRLGGAEIPSHDAARADADDGRDDARDGHGADRNSISDTT